MSRGQLYSPVEDARLLRLRAGGMTYHDIAGLMPGRSPNSVNYRHLVLLAANPGLKPRSKSARQRPARPQKKSRTCLIGGHQFEARIDGAGRFLEHICKPCKATTYYRSSIYAQWAG